MRYLFLIYLFCFNQIIAQSPPKREFRGAWIATVNNIDFPSTKTLTPDQQRAELTKILDSHQAAGLNAIFIQMRTNGDALYFSGIEPWSEFLTGKQGQAPQPFYDPAVFIIDECRKRGLECHFWLNPYRVVPNVTTAKLDSTKHIAAKHPEWLLSFGNLRILDPGIPDVRNYVTSVVMDIVRRYDVDGIHFDDYFYPYPSPPLFLNDDSTYIKYNRLIANVGDWRRDNVNLLIKQVSDSIKSIKPWVKFGISPFGIWQNKTSTQPLGSDTRGLQSYNDIYADSRKWIMEGWVDYIAPQVYWSIGFSVADFGILTPWWNMNAYNRSVFIGQAIYKVNTSTTGEPTAWLNPSEIPGQIRFMRQHSNIKGSLFYNTNTFIKNTLGVRDSVRTRLFQNKALVPAMTWKDAEAPPPPIHLTATQNSQGVLLKWSKPMTGTSEMDKIRGYVVYRFPENTPLSFNDPQFIRFITLKDTTAFLDNEPLSPQKYTYAITAFDRLYNESVASNNADIQVITSVENFVHEAAYLKNAPNPFSYTTQIEYALNKEAYVELRVYDLLGNLIANLVHNKQTAGIYSIDFKNEKLSAGFYIAVLKTEHHILIKKMIRNP
jgi:uncharacterized lipoprotein YddW (UPF0748 family)